MNEALLEIEEALRTVQTTLDALRARGDDSAAFHIARLQYSASIRASWPGNLLPLADALEKLDGEKTHLDAGEIAAARKAAAVFRKCAE